MKAQRILCPVDFSDSSDAALDVASKLARENGAKLFIVHVEEDPTIVHPGLVGGLPPVAWKEKHRLSNTLPTATEVHFEHDLLVGNPAKEIVEFAKRNDIDLIVMGSHGVTGLARILLGSVAEGVVRRSPAPVLTLKANGDTVADEDRKTGTGSVPNP